MGSGLSPSTLQPKPERNPRSAGLSLRSRSCWPVPFFLRQFSRLCRSQLMAHSLLAHPAIHGPSPSVLEPVTNGLSLLNVQKTLACPLPTSSPKPIKTQETTGLSPFASTMPLHRGLSPNRIGSTIEHSSLKVTTAGCFDFEGRTWVSGSESSVLRCVFA